ncbi:MAG TPA: MATE family efflux transporter [Gemmatimonadales bacterium]
MLRPRPEDIRALLRLAIPVVVVQVGLMSMGTVDTLMVGRVSASALAAVAIGGLYSMVATFSGQGVLMALDPIVSQAAGAGDRPSIALGVQRGLLLAAGLSVPLTLYHLVAGPVLRVLGQPADVVPLAHQYNVLLVPGILPFFGFIVLRQTLQALHRLRAIVSTILIANLVNAAVNWVFIFGNLGMPAMGVRGAALATSVSRWLMAFMLLALSWPELRSLVRPWLKAAYELAPLRRMVRLGVPIALQMELELICFGAVALLAGAMGTLQVAGHQIAINMAALTYMVPLGVSAAAAVMVGRAVGAGDQIEARRQGATALLVGVGFMSATAIGFLFLPGPLARLYTTDAAVITVAMSLIPLAGGFQVFDGTQVVAIGILRGLADTRGPFVINLMGYWVIGMPVGVWLAYPLGMGVVGLWWGLVIGLGAVALILVVRVRRVLRRPLTRFQVEHAAAEPVILSS